jgi:hypothetical protein
LRNRIYEYTFGGHIILVPFCGGLPLLAGSPSLYPNGEEKDGYTVSQLQGATTICRQVRSETAVLPFWYNDFHVLRQQLPKFLFALQDEQRNGITAIKLFLSGLDHPDRIVDTMVREMAMHTMKGLERVSIQVIRDQWEEQIKKSLQEILPKDVKVEYGHYDWRRFGRRSGREYVNWSLPLRVIGTNNLILSNEGVNSLWDGGP